MFGTVGDQVSLGEALLPEEVRTGSEARIATLQRGYGSDRTRLDGREGARTCTGHGVLAHNLVKISALAA